MSPAAWLGALLAVVVTAVVAVAMVSREDNDPAATTRSAALVNAIDDVVDVQCGQAVRSRGAGPPKSNAQLGPLTLVGGKLWARSRPEAFNGHGFKIPASLPDGMVATLAVPEFMRGRVGLVFTLATQDGVSTAGVLAADTAVRFTACPTGGRTRRSGWPGGIVVERPMCATLVVTVAGEEPVRRRIPLGRRC